MIKHKFILKDEPRLTVASIFPSLHAILQLINKNIKPFADNLLALESV